MKVFMFDEMTLKLYFMKCSERKIPQCILPFRNSRLYIFYFSYFDIMLKRNEFLWIFLSNGFDEKCKLTEIALSFIQKQYFS